MSIPQIPNPPPGQERKYPAPSATGKIPFSYGSVKSETYYATWGNLSGEKTPLIALHGGPGTGHSYLLPTALLTADHDIPVILYDQIGCGDSTHFRDKQGDTSFWTIEMFIAELENLKSALGIKEFDLLGQSWGGMMAAQYAISQPTGLRKLIIADSPSNMTDWITTANKLRADLPSDIQETLKRCEDEGRIESEDYQKATGYYYQLHMCRLQPFPAEFLTAMGNLMGDSTVYGTMCGPSEFFVTGSLKNWSITSELELITTKTCPGGMLVMNGRYDEAQDETMLPFFTRPKCPVKWVRYGLSSHLPMLEETEAYLKDLAAFLQT